MCTRSGGDQAFRLTVREERYWRGIQVKQGATGCRGAVGSLATAVVSRCGDEWWCCWKGGVPVLPVFSVLTIGLGAGLCWLLVVTDASQ